MGYSSITGTPKTFIQELKRDYNKDNFELIDIKATCFGKRIWIAYKLKDTGESIIALYKMKRYGQEWCYNGWAESAGPYEYDCPLELLDKTTGLKNETAIKWREQVRKYHANLKAISEEIKIGETVKVYGKLYKITEKVKKHYRAVCLENGNTYRLRVKQIERLEGSLGFIMNAAGQQII